MKFNEAVSVLKKASEKKDDLFIPAVLSKIAHILEENSIDKTAQGLFNLISQKQNKGQLLISKSEFKTLYNSVFDSQSIVRNALSNELGELQVPKIKEHKEKNQTDIYQFIRENADHTLVDGFQKMAGNSIPSILDQKIANQCEKNCSFEFKRFGLNPNVQFAGFKDGLALCQASFLTPKGTTNFLVPVEISGQNALIPTLFLSNGGFAELCEKNIKLALYKYAGENLEFLPQNILNTFGQIKRGMNLGSISEVEQIVIKSKLAVARMPIVQDAMLGKKFNEPIRPLNDKLKLSKQAEEISKQLTTNAGAAQFLFGKEAIDLGTKLISQSLNQFGYKNYQIKIASVQEKSVFYEVLLPGMKTFKIPAKITNNKFQLSNMIVSENGMNEFSKQALSELNINIKSAMEFSPSHDQNDNELVQNVKTAMFNGSKSDAEEALNLLQSRNSPLTKQAFNIYLQGINGTLKENVNKCSNQIKLASSAHILCGHTKLPLNKVYQDEFGQCQPLYRKNMPLPETSAIAQHRIIL